MAQSVETAANVQVAASRPRVVAQRAAVHAGGDRLGSGEVTSLGLRVCVDRIMVNARQGKDSIIRIADLIWMPPLVGDQQVEDCLCLLPAELLVQRRAGLGGLDLEDRFEILDRALPRPIRSLCSMNASRFALSYRAALALLAVVPFTRRDHHQASRPAGPGRLPRGRSGRTGLCAPGPRAGRSIPPPPARG